VQYIKTMAGLLAAFCLIVWGPSAVAGSDVVQPDPPYPPVEPPLEIVDGYYAIQSDPGADPETKIKAAIDIYFTLLLESEVTGEALDIGFLIDQSTLSGRNLRNYQMGRLEYLFAWWNHYSFSFPFTSYDYTPHYEAITVDGPRAVVDMVREVTFWKGERSSRSSGYRASHRLTLVLTTDGWKLTDDVSPMDPFRQSRPMGYDFAANMPPEDEADGEPSNPPPTGSPDSPPTDQEVPGPVIWLAAAGSLVLLGAVVWFLRRAQRTVGSD